MKKAFFLPIMFWQILLYAILINGTSIDPSKSSENELSGKAEVSEKTKSIVSSIVSITVFALLVIGVSIYYCYRNTKNIEKESFKFRNKLEKAYKEALGLSEVKVNLFLMSSIVPDRPITVSTFKQSIKKKFRARKRDRNIPSPSRQRNTGAQLHRKYFGDEIREDKTVIITVPTENSNLKSDINV